MQQPEHFRRVEKLEYIDADLGRPDLKHDVPKDRQTADEQNRYRGVLSGGEEPLFSFSRLPDQADTWQQRRNVQRSQTWGTVPVDIERAGTWNRSVGRWPAGPF
jgi:hypothetical protein